MLNGLFHVCSRAACIVTALWAAAEAVLGVPPSGKLRGSIRSAHLTRPLSQCARCARPAAPALLRPTLRPASDGCTSGSNHVATKRPPRIALPAGARTTTRWCARWAAASTARCLRASTRATARSASSRYSSPSRRRRWGGAAGAQLSLRRQMAVARPACAKRP